MVARKLGGAQGRMNRGSIEEFQDSETVLHLTSVVDTCLYAHVNTHSMYITSSQLWTLGDNGVSVYVR